MLCSPHCNNFQQAQQLSKKKVLANVPVGLHSKPCSKNKNVSTGTGATKNWHDVDGT